MGFSCSLLAVRGRSKAEVIQALGLQDTGAIEPFKRSKFYAAEAGDGWTIVFTWGYGAFGPRILAKISQGAEAVALQVEAHVMASDAWGFRHGTERWAVLYDCNKGPDVEARGELPPAFAGIRAEALRQTEEDEDGPDYVFEVPVLVMESVCGFTHESAYSEIPDGLGGFTALKRDGLLARLFGSR